MRNRIIHGYATIDYELVWIVINRDIEDLDAKLRSMKTVLYRDLAHQHP
jgi:uncharacterized protein with HEPN domain